MPSCLGPLAIRVREAFFPFEHVLQIFHVGIADFRVFCCVCFPHYVCTCELRSSHFRQLGAQFGEVTYDRVFHQPCFQLFHFHEHRHHRKTYCQFFASIQVRQVKVFLAHFRRRIVSVFFQLMPLGLCYLKSGLED
eukprot:GEMP01082691.1.p2 GENE.GEMP01082691.1~~GEMP01082691.1.p2  ORF type:complete len:136 (-),score=15.92 GEMP01082691.1:336-743(-)